MPLPLTAARPRGPARRLTRRRFAALAAITVTLSVLLVLVTVGALDVYLHWRTQDLAGVNVWGYRGAPLGPKRPGEIRIVMLGGSTVFGYGLPSDESIPALLTRRLNAPPPAGGRRFTVINLGAPGEGAYGFRVNLEDYAYLGYDAALLYEGYNDLGVDGVPEGVPNRAAPNYLLWRRQSPVFRLTGYYPIFPLVLREKAMAMLHGGDLNAAYGQEAVVFRPNLATRTAASALETAAAVGESVERQLGSLGDGSPAPAADPSCRERWRQYCGAVGDAVAWALGRGTRVMVITQPYVSDRHVEQQTDLAAMLSTRFRGQPHLQYVNLGHVVDLRDSRLAYDRLHLVAEANDRVAARLADPVLQLLQ